MDFRMEKGKIEEIVDTLHQIKTLEEFDICEPTWGSYLLSPKDLELFKYIPIACIDSEGLDLNKKENIPLFLKVIKKHFKSYNDEFVELLEPKS